jgi:PAS domain S-box-containing protein
MVGDTPPELAVRVLVVAPPTGDAVGFTSQLTFENERHITVQTVSGPDTARRVLDEHHVDCVVCAHEPPAIDGVEVLSTLREAHPNLPILLAADTSHVDSAVGGTATDVVQVTDGEIHEGVVANRIASIVVQARQRGKYEQIFDRANDGILLHDPESGDILEANDRFYRMLGYDANRPERLTVGDVVAGVDEYTEATARDLVRRAATEGGHTVEWLFRTADGNRRWVEVGLEPTTLGGVDRVLAFVRDITERKEDQRLLRDREQQLEAIFNHPASFAVVLDENGRVVRANQSALGYTTASQSAIEGVPFWETPWWAHDETQTDRIRRAVERTLDGETERVEVTLVVDSERRVLDLQFEPTRAAGAGEHTSVAVGYDITERKERERDLEDSRETFQRLHEITSDPEMTFEEQVDRLLAFGSDQLGLDIGFLSRIDEADGHFEIVAARGDHELIQSGNESDLAETYCRRTIDAETEAPLAVQDASAEMAGDPAYEKFGLGCYLGAEIVVDGDLYGTFCFADDDPRSVVFSDEERTLVDLTAQWLRRGLEQRTYQRELEETRDRLSRTLERIDDAFFAVDDDWRFTYVNETGADVLLDAMDADLDADALLGRNIWEAVPDAVGTPFYEHYHEALETQEPVSFEAAYDPLDVWLEVQAYPDADGLSVYFTDITERKERERALVRLQNLLEQTERIADVGGWELDPDTGEVFWSEHLFDLLGVEDDREPPLEEVLDIALDEDRDVLADAVDAAVESGEPFDVELRYRRPGDGRGWIRVQGVPVDADGDAVSGDAEVVSVRGAAQDITERKERERTLNALLSATRAFIRANDRDELVAAVTDGADAVFDYEITSVRLHDRAAGTLPPTHVSPGAAEYVTDPPTFDVEGSAAGAAFRSGEPRVVDDLAADTDHDYGPLGSAAFIPLGDHGVLGIGAMERGTFDEGDVALVELLAVAAASAFDRLEQESEMRNLQRIIDHVDQKVFLLDGDGAFAYVTRSLATYLGRDRDRLVGVDLVDIVTDADTPACEAALAEAAAGDGDSVTVELDVHRRDGTTSPVQVEVTRTRGTDAAATIAGDVTDISELAQTRTSLAAERERFRELFENLPDPVVEVEFEDGTPLVRYANPAFGDVFGYDDAVAGVNLNDLVVPDHERRDAAEIDSDTMDGRQTRVEVQRETAGGTRDFLLRSIPYPREGGVFAFAVYTDITDQKERERYLQVLHRVLRHNLRNDLNVVMALARRLRTNVEDEQLAEHARMLEDNAADVASLSEKAKEIERVVGRRGTESGAVDAVRALRDAVDELLATHPDASVSLDVPDSLWVRGSGDLGRAFEELVENALEHNDGSEPRLEIEARPAPRDGEYVDVLFRDDGPGISDAEWRVISGEADITQLSHGSGLGLWLSRWTVESFGGQLDRVERDEPGTTVRVSLRRAEQPRVDSPTGTT